MDQQWTDILANLRVIDNQVVVVSLCKPSKRKAASSIQKAKYSRLPQSGALFVAKDRGLKLKREDKRDD